MCLYQLRRCHGGGTTSIQGRVWTRGGDVALTVLTEYPTLFLLRSLACNHIYIYLFFLLYFFAVEAEAYCATSGCITEEGVPVYHYHSFSFAICQRFQQAQTKKYWFCLFVVVLYLS